MHYLYKITDILNNKVYIGQTVDFNKRWGAHKSYAKNPERTGQYIHRAMAKYGVENFIYEVIATCLTQEAADEAEEILIKQYDSQNKEYGYNVKPGGNVATHSEETKQKLREAIINQIATRGHPAQGTKRTPEQSKRLSQTRLEHPVDYTPEKRSNMSVAHIGIKDTEETKQKKSESARQAWEKRADYEGIKCQAPDCDVSGKAKYKIIEGTRYCNKHGLRMLRYGRLETL